MREFPPIDRATEAAAAQTVFFTDAEFEGRQIRKSRANYLAFLSMRGAEVEGEIKKLRALFSEHPAEVLERDVVCLLAAVNWRVHNIACAVIAAGFVTDLSLASLWQRIHDGSWTSPQLVATAAYVDSEFAKKALQMLSDRSTYFKSIVPLAELLLAEHGMTEVDIGAAVANVQEARTIDRDNSGAIGLTWLANLRTAFGSTFERRI
ncbi:hypothetical protein [Scleromatobacter humisilvae]|uniref:Uncharacterized protein n=1 Tax=Scleromatobacter humisilvae TaxID=2897159 RepID=A0A9X1YJE7_9BURK|nr:hypothetical protein [Scleromatobacter humisilvae]MCK9687419.1 hypothetical protein [Scleromatobacter humisilvae]